LSDKIKAVGSVEEACAGASIIIHAVPAQKTPHFIQENHMHIPKDAIYCSVAKGLFLEKKCLLSEAMLEAFDRQQPLAVLSGPSFAKEIAQESPTVVVVASKFLYHAVSIQRALSNLTFRIYASQDLIGVELGGALKNPLAIGAGCIEGSGYGINTMAAYLTRACRELQMLCVAMGGKSETVNGLSGIGDLMLTAFGDLSRNRTCGKRLAKGEKLEDILAGSTVEGVPTAEVAIHFAKMCNLELPIFTVVHGLINGSVTKDEAAIKLMGRRLGTESADI
jgi:glycerol-3-phosphate dehydrogenase (NAD+)